MFTDFSGPIIAPLWCDFHSSFISGSKFYRSYTQDKEILGRVKEMIANASTRYSDYQPTLAVIVTWNSLLPYFENPVLTQTRVSQNC